MISRYAVYSTVNGDNGRIIRTGICAPGLVATKAGKGEGVIRLGNSVECSDRTHVFSQGSIRRKQDSVGDEQQQDSSNK